MATIGTVLIFTKNVLIIRLFLVAFATSIVLALWSCNSVHIPISVPCIVLPQEFSRIIGDSLQAHGYSADSAGIGYVRSYRWFNDGTSVRKVMVVLNCDTSAKRADMTVVTTILFRGSETTVNYTETTGFPAAFRRDFYPLLASLRAYCSATLPVKKKRKRTMH